MQTEETYKQWDNFIHKLIICCISAQKKYKYFIIGQVNPKEPYDLFFFRINTIANTFVKGCKVFGYTPNIIKYWKFRFKERKFRSPSSKALDGVHSGETHICTYRERVQLIEQVAENCGINPEDIPTIYGEYYKR